MKDVKIGMGATNTPDLTFKEIYGIGENSFMKLIFIFMNIMKNKYKLIKMDVNIYYLELMFILMNFY